MLRGELVREFDGLIERAHDDYGAVFIDRPARDGSGGKRRQLLLNFLRYLRGQPLRSGEQDGARVGIVFGLCQHVGGDKPRIGVGGNNEYFCGTRDEIDTDFTREEFLGCRNIDVARTYDTVRARHRFGSVSKGGDGLRAAHLKHLMNAKNMRGPEDFVDRFGAGGTNVPYPGDDRGNGGHDDCGRQRVSARGNVGRYCVERPDDLSEAQSGRERRRIFTGQLPLGEAADIAGRDFDGAAKGERQAIGGGGELRRFYPDGLPVERIEPARIFKQALIPALADGFEDRTHRVLRLRHTGGAAGQNAAHVFRFQYADHVDGPTLQSC